MKNIIKIISLLSLCILLSVTVFATTNQDDGFTNHDHDITVVFSKDTSFTQADQERIENYIITGNQLTSHSVWCSLFGHNMSYTGENIITVSHRVYSNDPRCLEETYDIYSCSTCGELSSRLIGSSSKSCC